MTNHKIHIIGYYSSVTFHTQTFIVNFAIVSVKWKIVFIGRNDAVSLETSKVYKQYPELSIEWDLSSDKIIASSYACANRSTISTQIRSLIHLCIALFILVNWRVSYAIQPASIPHNGESPLSYIRNLTIAPVNIDIHDSYDQTIPMPKSIKGGYQYWVNKMLSIQQQRDLMQEAASAFPDYLRERLWNKEHIRLAISEVKDHIWTHRPFDPAVSDPNNTSESENSSTVIKWASLSQLAESSHSQGAIAFSMDYFHNPTKINDTFWIRFKGYYYRLDNKRQYGPFYVYGNIQSGLLYLYTKSILQERIMMKAALEECANRVAETLNSGKENPFAIKKRTAVLPAIVPNTITILEGARTTHIPLTEVNRQADVLFQPSIGPVVTLLHVRYDFHSYPNLLTQLGKAWKSSDDIDVSKYSLAGKRMQVSYVFISRINGITIKMLGQMESSNGVEVPPEREVALSVDGALIDPSTSKILWRKSADAVVVIRKRSKDALTNNQCALEAAIVAYSKLNADYNAYQRKWLIPIPFQ